MANERINYLHKLLITREHVGSMVMNEKCNGINNVVYFTKFYANDDKTSKVSLPDAIELGFAIIDNFQGQIPCISDSFDGADPSPGHVK